MRFGRINIGNADLGSAIPNRIAIHDSVGAAIIMADHERSRYGVGGTCGEGSDAANRGYAE